MTGRRRLLMLFGATALAPRIACAQSKQRVVIGWLNTGSRDTNRRRLAAFEEGMAALGWKEGSNYVLEERWADGKLERLPSLAKEIVARKPALIVSATASATRAAAKDAPGIPVVQAYGNSPVNSGLAKNLARPGGIVTGVTNMLTDVSEKYLELLARTG